jgi:peptidoglycan/LPS O-acetylase OafA/YrhL
MTPVPPAVSNVADAGHSALLDNWRGWAILFVLLGHFFEVRGANLGRVGVELFFVLSGRLMADLLFVRHVEIGKFFLRRLTRVLPVSLLFLATDFVIFPTGVNQLTAAAAAAAVTMTINYMTAFGIVGSSVVGHYWSLCVEEHSYIALAFVALLLRRAGKADGLWPAVVCLSLALAMIVNGWRLWQEQADYYAVYWRSDVRAATIFMSVGLRVLFARGALQALRAPWIPIATAVVGIALNTRHVPDPIKYSLGSILIALSINSLEQAWPFARRLLSSTIIGWFGLVSYSLYIWQQPFYELAHHYGPVPLAAGAIAVAAAIYYLYESPLRIWLNARISGTPVASPVRSPRLDTAH